MPTTHTKRMEQIADDLRQEGAYTSANSVDAVTRERDELFSAAKPFCEITVTAAASIGQVTPEQVNVLREIVQSVESQKVTTAERLGLKLDRPAERGKPVAWYWHGSSGRIVIREESPDLGSPRWKQGAPVYAASPERTADARDAVIEECAKVCVEQTYGRGKVRLEDETFLSACDSAEHDGFYLAKMRCAEAIRALKSPAPLKELGR